MIQTVFKRYEIKYRLSGDQAKTLRWLMDDYMMPDEYGKTTIRNVYYDTDHYRLARRSIESPHYKEKLRIRSYGKAETEDKIFVELKKKFASVVYKRRVLVPQRQAIDWLTHQAERPNDSQIAREIDYFLNFYQGLRPRCYLSYDREAYFAKDDPSFRMTFDRNIKSRFYDLTLGGSDNGEPLLGPQEALLEVKTAGALPLWLTHFLTKQNIYKCSFSKYGRSYQNQLQSAEKARYNYA